MTDAPVWWVVGAVGTILGTLLLMGGILFLDNHASLPGHLADIEQLRQDAAGVDPQQAEDVIGQVAERNRWLAQTQALNDTWWFGWTIPDEYDTVPFIEVPR